MESNKINVFMVDDEISILRVYSLHFKLNGFNVVGTATNGLDAVKMLSDSIERPDVIIMDYHMPGINGIEASKRILEYDRSLKIIMISADPYIKQHALSNGLTDFFEKSKNIKELCQRIKEIISADKFLI